MKSLFVDSAKSLSTSSETENGDKTFSSSNNFCTDLFFQIGAIRGQKPERVRELFSAAFAEDREIATRIALYARDIREGMGERETFRQILTYLSQHESQLTVRLIPKIVELGRFDDLLHLIEDQRCNEPVARAILEFYSAALRDNHGLAAKWAPRECHNRMVAARLRNFMRLTPKQYRKMVSSATKVVEQQMCAKEWPEINYEHVPSVASARYAKAFGKHDNARYGQYLENVKSGTKKINTAAVYPYDVLKKEVDDRTADVMWNNLKDYVPEGFSFLPVVDVSGSMGAPANSSGKGSVTCMDVSLSLGLYLAERQKGVFKDVGITFSAKPSVFTVPKGTVREKIGYLRNRPWNGQNTDLDMAMQLVVDIGINAGVSQAGMPNALIILSDMEFDHGKEYGGDKYSNMYLNTSVSERTKKRFNDAGYIVPNIIWWNIQSRSGSTPVRFNEYGMALVSGFSPSIMTLLLSGEDMSPRSMMLKAVGKDRYAH